MKNIEVVVLDMGNAHRLRTLTALAARISQRGQSIKNVDDLKAQLTPANDSLLNKLVSLPHPTLQKFSTIEILFLNVSRRFTAQLTRHQDCKFMSSSFRYADHTDSLGFVTPIEIIRAGENAVMDYDNEMYAAKMEYIDKLSLVGRDAAGYYLPLSAQTTILCSATAFQWKHMIQQRTCHRAGHEMRYAMLLAWRMLENLDSVYFSPEQCGPLCMSGNCLEGSMGCKNSLKGENPASILLKEYPELYGLEEEKESSDVC